MANGLLEPHERQVEAWAVKCRGQAPALFLDKVRAEFYAAQHRGVVVKLMEVTDIKEVQGE